MSRLAISEEDFLNRATEKVKENLNNPRFGVSELAREMGMSRSNLHRKIQKVVKISASSVIRQVRLEKAMELLRQTSLTVSDLIVFYLSVCQMLYFPEQGFHFPV